MSRIAAFPRGPRTVQGQATRRSLVRFLGPVAALATALVLGVGTSSAASPTAVFGSTTIGSTSDSPTSNYKFGSVFTLSQPGRTVSFSWYSRGGAGDQAFVPVIYGTDAAGNPAGLVAQAAQTVVKAGQAAGWVTSALPAVDLQPGKYLLGLIAGSTSKGAVNYFTATPGTNYWNQNAYPAPSSTWGQINVSAAVWSAYVTYTPVVSPPQSTTAPAISGTAQQDQTLQVSNGAWSNNPTSYAYEWRRCDSGGAGCTAIPAATAASYTLVSADVGATIVAAVTASNGGGSSTAPTAATAVVQARPAPAPTPASVFGKTTVGTSSDSPGSGAKFGTVYTLSSTAQLTSFSWYTRGGASDQKFVPVVYSTDATGVPASLVAQGSETVVRAGQAAGWVTASLPAVTLQPGSYLLGLESGPNNQGAVNYYDATPGTNYWNMNAYPTPSSSWGQVNISAAAWSAYVAYTAAPLAAIAAPDGLAASTTTQTSVSLSWTASSTSSVTGYDVLRDGSAAGSTTSTAYTVAGLACGTSYTFAVDAHDSAGNTSTPSSVTAATAACPPSPSPTPAPSGSLYVSLAGADTNACTQAAPCASFARAYQVASPGTVVVVSGGAYPSQQIPIDASKTSSTDVVFQPASGATVSIPWLDIYGNHVVFQGTGLGTGFNVQSWMTRPGAGDVTLANVNTGIFSISGSHDVTITGGQVGPWTSGSLGEDPQISRSADGTAPTNITIDGVYFHDVQRGSPTDHTECLQFGAGQNVVIRNNRFVRCSDHDIFIRSWGGAGTKLIGFVLENNFFGPTSNGFYNGQFAQSADLSTCDSFVLRYNTLTQPWSVGCAPSSSSSVALQIYGNLWAMTFDSYGCYNGGIYRDNYYSAVTSTKCDPSDTVGGNPLFVDPVNSDFHLQAGSPARGAGDQTRFPATDIDGDPRTAGTVNAGADQ
jgi:fibronectin type 3 domain-containing protein